MPYMHNVQHYICIRTFCSIAFMYSHIEYISDTLEGQKNASYFNYTSLFFIFEACGLKKKCTPKILNNYYINTFSFKNKHTKTKCPDVLGGFWLLQPSRHAHSLHVHHRWFGLGSFMARCNLEFDEATPGGGVFFLLVRNFLKTTPLKISMEHNRGGLEDHCPF